MSTLRARRVTRQLTPRYPTKLEVLATPKLLEKHQPAAWLSNRELAAAAGVFLAANAAGCSKSATQSSPAKALAPDAPAIVAPIFEHGDGRGAAGCVVTSPPVFLSEEEALQVIREELARGNLGSFDENVELPSVQIPQRVVHYEITEGKLNEEVRETGSSRPLSVDFHSRKQRIALEYVSCQAYCELGGPQDCSSVDTYDFREVATSVADRVEKSAKGVYFGVFYDPATNPRQFVGWTGDKNQRLLSAFGGSDEQRGLATTESKRLLRQQVKDFVEWLKGQGVI